MKIKFLIRPKQIWVLGSVLAVLITVSGCGAKAPKAFSASDIEKLNDAFTFEDQSPFPGISGDVNLNMPDSVKKFPTGATHLSARLGAGESDAEALDGEVSADDFRTGVVSSASTGTAVDSGNQLFLFLRNEKVTEASDKAIAEASAAGEPAPDPLVDSVYSGVSTTAEDQIGLRQDQLDQLAGALSFEDQNTGAAGVAGSLLFNIPASVTLPTDVTHFVVKLGQSPSQAGDELTTVGEVAANNFSDALVSLSQVLNIEDGDSFHLYLRAADLPAAIGNVVYSGLSLRIEDIIEAGGEVVDAEPEPEPELAPEPEPEPEPVEIETYVFGVISVDHFEFDKYNLTEDSKQRLTDHVNGLENTLDAYYTVAGHADERGTNEYNLALGERRALAVKNYLVALGVPSDNITTVSYGEERPEDPASNEDAWQKNRRSETQQNAAQ